MSAVARRMSAQQALALPSPAASNIVVINARCSLRIEAEQRVIIVAVLPVHHYRGEDRSPRPMRWCSWWSSGFAVARPRIRSADGMAAFKEERLIV